jgi:hypothetical protein
MHIINAEIEVESHIVCAAMLEIDRWSRVEFRLF